MNRRIGAFVLMAAIGIAVAGRPVFARSCDLVQRMDSGQIDWTQMTIEANGIGAPSPKGDGSHRNFGTLGQIAYRNAYENLLKLTSAMQLTATKSVGEYLKNKGKILAGLEDRLKDASLVSTRYLSGGSVRKTLKVHVGGPLLQLILPTSIVQLEMKTMGEETPPPNADKYTGLLVDARGIPIKPALVVQIVDESGEEVYGPAYVSRNYAAKGGFCGYVEDIKSPEVKERVGSNPLIVKALRIQPPGASDLVVSNTDASRIRGVVQHLFFLRRCRVVIVVDKSACDTVKGRK